MLLYAAAAEAPIWTDKLEAWSTFGGAVFTAIAVIVAFLVWRHDQRMRREDKLDSDAAQARLLLGSIPRSSAAPRTACNVVGGHGRFALFHQMGDWQYSDPVGSDDEVRLWTSDQGYFCAQRNILTDINKVLRIVKAYYESGSYADLDAVP